MALAAAVSAGGGAQAGFDAVLPAPPSILPVNIGVGVASSDAVRVTFSEPMDRDSVESALTIAPAHTVVLRWSDDSRSAFVDPRGLWSTDRRYALVVAPTARTAGGALLGGHARFSFTTATAPRITDFGVRFVAEPVGGAAALEPGSMEPAGPPPDTASSVSAETSISITFSAPMNRIEVERAFVLSPSVPGIFRWTGTTLTFQPIERLESDARYTVTLIGAHDRAGNALDGDAAFSFTTRPGAQLVQTTPATGATGVRDGEIVLWFSQPMDPSSVLLAVSDNGAAVGGTVAWNATATQLRFTPSRAFAAGHRFDVGLAAGAIDADGNAVTAALSFTTRPAPPRRVSIPATPPAPTLTGYALNQINAARAAYGLPALRLDNAISSVAQAHAADLMANNYFSHTNLQGMNTADRLRAAGIVFGWSGENLCMNNGSGRTTTEMLAWCHSQFMSEPYPGYANHIGNILHAHYTRVGVGIAIVGAKTIIVWDFAD
ncbi:MAG: Ig-like domain-containing protein [Chloroflexota bacterium]